MPWLPTLSAERGPIYVAVADALEGDLKRGRLQPGERLPSQRELAQQLGVDLTTITRAYAEASRRGLVESEGRRGSFVRSGKNAAGPADEITPEVASGMNLPPDPEDGSVREAITTATKALLEGQVAPMQYQPSGGTDADRAVIALFLSRLIPDTAPDQVVITAGAQHALHAVASILLAGGGRVAAGCFTYPGFLAVARRLGSVVIPLAMDTEGIIPEAFAKEAAAGSLRAIYLVPTNDNPTTATMSTIRRNDIAEIARRFGVPIIEDDVYGRLPEAPLAPLAALAPELTWHISGVSKAISPSLRVAFVRAPTVRQALQVAGDVHETAVMAPPINVAMVTCWMGDGTFLKLVAAVRTEAVARLRVAAGALMDRHLDHHPEGYHLWLPLDLGLNAADIAGQAMAAGLPAAPSAAFSACEGPTRQALRISLGGSRSRESLARELRRLDAIIAQAGTRRRPFV